MNILTQKARRRQRVVKIAMRKGKSFASRMYGVSLSSVKRWCKHYDGTWQSLREGSHRPHIHPNRHTEAEERLIKKAFKEKHLRMEGVSLRLRLRSKPSVRINTISLLFFSTK